MCQTKQHPENLIKLITHNLGRFTPGLIVAIARGIIVAPLPWIFSVIVDRHIASGDTNSILVLGLLALGLLMLHFAFAVSGAKLIGANISALIRDLRGSVFNKMQFLSFGYLDQSTTGRLISKYAFDSQKVQDSLLLILNQLVPNTFYGLSVLFILILLNWQLTIVVLLMLPLLAISKQLFYRQLQDRNHETRMAQEKLTGTANELISALRLVRSLGEESKAEAHMNADNHAAASTRFNQINTSSVFGTFMFVSNQFMIMVIIAGGSLLVIDNTLSLGVLLAFIAGVNVIMMPINMITQFAEMYFVGEESYRSIRELLDCNYVERWKGDKDLPKVKGDIRFDDVQFAYPSKPDTQVLKHFNLHIRPGENVALVGASGSGKSTLANLTLGLYETSSGRILVDGTPQDQLNMRALRRQCAIVMQDNILLSGTVRDNIRFAREDATEEEIIAAAQAANAEEFIRDLPEGYDTIIGERGGASLSGGQRQRLSIARAILRDPRILILDEATSALDNESEHLIQQALERLAQGRTVITIAHRLSTIRNADRIIVMGHGQILEQGRFDELARDGKYFKGLLRNQMDSAYPFVAHASA